MGLLREIRRAVKKLEKGEEISKLANITFEDGDIVLYIGKYSVSFKLTDLKRLVNDFLEEIKVDDLIKAMGEVL